MGTVEKRNKHKKRRFVFSEEKLERELKDCMHCRFFWGHNNRCANGTCCKPSKKKEQKLPAECVGCPYYRGKELPICTYNEDGSFKEDIHYTVVETKAADGYILDETAHDVTLRYDDNAPDVVVTTLKLINVPTEPKLPQTGDNANPLLYLGIGALALITGVGVGLRGRKKKNKQ